ncbi:hypothetical protein Pcinc_018209 [Petrolisthes cinctipes]|uniref:Uncharacterized protein n=1 Tax=Petrolisthes cinctipes TaxID=88211 RepID=A0AAE1FMM2_PETCI|nr:hypothetical protein Pcinc_018209 [Petrolisthes cinctipes]
MWRGEGENVVREKVEVAGRQVEMGGRKSGEEKRDRWRAEGEKLEKRREIGGEKREKKWRGEGVEKRWRGIRGQVGLRREAGGTRIRGVKLG